MMAAGTEIFSVEKLMETAHFTGVLSLKFRNLKAFPRHKSEHDLRDTVAVDLSHNKLADFPSECTSYHSLERLVLYHNVIRSIPDSIVRLHSLRHLDLSRNALTYMPASVCELPNLQALIVNNNRLVSLPEELAKMSNCLMELDASCNEITHLPVQIGDLTALRILDLRRNHLQEVPVEISYLQLTSLDLGSNRITALPVELRFMTTVTNLQLGDNPLSCPPANLVSRGRVHIFKYLEIQAIKEDRKRGVITNGSDTDYNSRRSYRKTVQLNDFKFANGLSADARRKRHTADSGYGSEQPTDRRWSQEFNQFEEYKDQTEEARRIIMRAANMNSNQSGRTTNMNGSGTSGSSFVNNSERLSVAVPSSSSSSTASSTLSQQHPSQKSTHRTTSAASPVTDIPGEHEREERHRAASHHVLVKQGLKARPNAELTASALSRMQLQDGSVSKNIYDVKAMQKEAVLSYVKSKQVNPARSLTGGGGGGSIPDLGSYSSNKLLTNGTRASSTTSIPQPSTVVRNSVNHNNNVNNSRTRREAEKASSADGHIASLRHEIESRLRITMPEDMAVSLADGVILCHIANHVRPRAVPTIHVPSPGVPKLTLAKGRKNVENFLLACRKIGVREELICSLSDVMEPRRQGTVRVSISVSELLRFHQQKSQLP